MSNYDNIHGVGYRHFVGEEDEPRTDDRAATIDEMYYEEYSGDLVVRVSTSEGHVSLSIPVKATERWDKFVESLPRWD